MPFGYTHNKVENYDQQKQVGNAAAEAIRKWYGTDYKVGSTAELLCKILLTESGYIYFK